MATPFKLYELSDAYYRLAEMMEEGAEGLEDTLEAINESMNDKIESIIKLANSMVSEKNAIDEERHRLGKRAEQLDKQIQWLHTYVENSMLHANVTKIKSNLFDIALHKTPPRVVVTDETLIPEQFLRLVPARTEPDKMAIKDAIKYGGVIPGVELKQDMKLKVR